MKLRYTFSKFFLPTVNFHLQKDCNYKCSFCYAHFENSNDLLTKEQSFQLIKKLKDEGNVGKINFAGGEPLLNPFLGEYIQYAKNLGIVTSIVTNASRMTIPWLNQWGKYIDQIAVSCDSQYDDIQKQLGRGYGDHVRITTRALQRIHQFNQSNNTRINVKLNSVINRTNFQEDMRDFILQNKIKRWKILKILLIKGENDDSYKQLEITNEEFNQFCQLHLSLKQQGVDLAFEDNDMMIQSYIMIDPSGKFYQNTHNYEYIYSQKIINSSVQQCLEEVGFNIETFKKRGGFYSL